MLSLWIVLVVILATWQSGSYGILVGGLAEWQFNEFGVYLPLLTYLALVGGLALLPPFVIWLVRLRKARAPRPEATAANLARAIGDATRFRNFLLSAALVSMIACCITLVMVFFLPRNTGTVHRLSASASVPSRPPEGPAQISGTILYDKTAAFDERLWFFGRNVRFAPIVENGADDRLVRYFVELPPVFEQNQPRAGLADLRRGILKREGLPGELVRLYQYAGFDLAKTNYVLFSSEEVMRWPYLIWAWEFLIAAVVFGLFALIQIARRRKLKRIAQARPS